MKLTEKEEKIARLALDNGAKDGERAAAAKKLIESLHARGVSVEDITKEEVHTEYIYTDPPPPPRPERRDAPWDPDPEVRRRNYEEADAAGYRWDRQYGYQPPPPPPETSEEKDAREKAEREQQAEYERQQQEMQYWAERREREAQERERARQAVLAARPLYIKWASAIGYYLGPYSNCRGYTGNPAFEAKIQLIFGLILLFLIALLPVMGVFCLFYYYPITCFTLLLVFLLGFYCYYLCHSGD
jgi:hypothetical protein